jgi:hypothetical protein
MYMYESNSISPTRQAFKEIKALISEDVLLLFPDITKPFHLFTDASDYQLGATIVQDGKPIALYSRKLTPTQQRYSTIDKNSSIF